MLPLVMASARRMSLVVVPMPLQKGVPHRAKIVCSLWRAGCSVDSKHYPEAVQPELHWLWLIGAHFKRLEDGKPSDDSSSWVLFKLAS